ncbi:cell wall-binding repeat-containing protein [Agrococcus jejuensis]|uniref:Putative cell wall binding repeat 2 n=1 Tax=Agrococcus jejuensis TaxID=399736 RepID=A0A1G8F4W2_9MICO|nr:cell wall-binding repeat-containing protein [Agrococcus jejuensis]SDH77144.1 Putative cell wall binding repeat 2 [Agrococcus jejuensis]
MSTTTPRRVALRRCLASLAAVTIGLGGVVVSTTAASAATPSPATPVDLSSFTDGRYVVLLEDDAAALYTGGVPNLQATAPTGTDSLDDADPAVVAYSDYLAGEQEAVADAVGVDIAASLTLTVNGFIADLSADQAGQLAFDSRVAGVYPDEMLQLQGSPSNEYLDVEGMWSQVGTVEDAGAGVVVGVLDTGIAPENPLFAGEALGTTAGAEPYLSGDEIHFVKGDGETFTGICETGPGFTADMCSTKIIGAQFFLDGFGASRIGGEGVEIASPRDLDGHGSHTASTAAGNYDVPVTTEGGQDIGTMSGVAPEARIAVYKVCWSGNNPDPAVTTDDGCSGTDLMQGIEAATADGVDVINFSIGGGAAASVFEPYDQAFLGAAAAGIFTSASAGNSGPGATTLDHASPWYATVANTTIPNYEATIELEDGTLIPGASITVDMAEDAEPFTGTLVYAGDIPAAGASAANAALCLPGSLATVDPGTIVLCDRGNNARVEKSEVVEAAGGIGMILGNPTPNSIDLDDHAVPTVHIDAAYYAAVLAVAQADPSQTVSFTAGNSSGIDTAAPIVAASSSRGPVEADGNDVIKPDIAAPGTGIIAAGPNGEGEAPTFRFLSGTSMAAPHVAGLAAVYLGAHPLASVAEVKSALMTTATDTVNADGSPNQDWFAQGAGFVNTADFLDPGVYYANGLEDWYGYLRGVGYELPDEWIGAAIDPSDLNIPSIGIGSLAGTQTVTRSLTALEPGSYAVTIDAPEGVDAVVSPTTLDFTAAGQELTYTVSFTVQAGAPTDAWTTGSLTWASAEHEARSPIAVYPVSVDAPQWIEGSGTAGVAPVTVTSGITGEIGLGAEGLFPYEELGAGSAAAGQFRQYGFTVGEGELALDFDLDSADDASDLDLVVARLQGGSAVELYEAATGSADEQLLIEDPTPGTWVAQVTVYASNGATTAFTLDVASVLTSGGIGNFEVDPTTLPVTQSAQSSYEVSWADAPLDGAFLGAVTYDTTDAVRTYVRITTGEATIPAPERIAGGDRFETAVAASQLGYPEGADVVYLASGVNYPDGLAAGPAAAYEGGPLLLTRPETTPASIVAEIERLGASRVVIVGGTPSVSAAVETQVGDIDGVETVDRIGGADRFETSRLVAEYAFGEGAGTAFLATGRNFPDALTAGAAAGSMDAPVILIDGQLSALDGATLATLQDLGVTQTLVAGSSASVSDGIYRDLVNAVMNPYRAAGADRFLTGVYINEHVFDSADTMFVASGLKFPDALSASALAGAMDAPLYVVRPECVPSELISESLRLGQPDVYFMGDSASLGAGAESYTICG